MGCVIKGPGEAHEPYIEIAAVKGKCSMKDKIVQEWFERGRRDFETAKLISDKFSRKDN